MLDKLLKSTGSLTKKLEALAGQPLQVKIVHQGFESLGLDDRLFFARHNKNPAHSMAWVRRTELFGNDDSPWVLATCIFLASELKGTATRLPHIGNTPIGYILFKRQKNLPFTRSYLAKNGQPARQTLYNFYGHMVFVEEIFLPNFVEKLSSYAP